MPPRQSAALRPFHPIVRQWFTETLGQPSAPQKQGWPAIARGEHTLILAPTGTGKTLAAFLWELNALITEGLEKPLANAIHLLYISPLKALNNDVQRNLELPLAQLKERFERAGEAFPEIRIAVRTGDTPSSARQRMLRKTPQILITTPESLHILLTSVRGRTMFSALRGVIVDEIHAIAGSKRGAHLALTLERLEELCDKPPQRIGLSATQKPLEEIAKFLGGLEIARNGRTGDAGGSAPPDRAARSAQRAADDNPSPAFRPVRVVDAGSLKEFDTKIVSPVEDLGRVGGTIWTSVAPLVLQYIRESRTTLIFVNNRAQAERIAARVNQLAGEEIAQPYHGSLSRERRQDLERRLKAGALRALVSTSSLELGIDIGTVDLVVQLQSPKRVASALQRIGRAGHTLGAVSRGVFVPTFRDDGMEILAIMAGVAQGDVEPTKVVQNALDVLAQVIVATVALDDDWTAARLFEMVRRAYPYHALTRAAFDEVLAMLSGKYPSDVASELEPRLSWDRITDTLSAPRSSRLVAVTSGGTIPDRGLYAVVLPDRTRLGELDEEFVHETRIGDVFQLGSSTWRVGSIEHDRVIVTPAPGAPARMPFWHGEFMARSAHLTPRVGVLRRELDAARTMDDIREVMTRYGCDEATATSMATYVHEQRTATKALPDDRTLVLEHFRDELGSVRLVLHAPFGGRVTAPWGMAIAQRVRERLADMARRDESSRPRSAQRAARSRLDSLDDDGPGFEIQVQTTDDAIMLRLPDLGAAPPIDAVRGLRYAEAEKRVIEEVGSSSLFGARFRMNAARALLLPRGGARRRMPLWLQRLKALDLLEAVKEYPSFPILVETYRDVLQDAFDMPALAEVLGAIEEGRIRIEVAETEMPSPFAASLQFGFVMDWMYADDAPRAEQRAAILSLDRALLDELMGAEGADESTLEILEQLLARRRGTAPKRRARDADELAVLMDRAGDLTREEIEQRTSPPEQRRVDDPLAVLLASGRAVSIDIPVRGGMETRIILAETFARYAAAFGIEAMAEVGTGRSLERRPARDVIPEEHLAPTLTTSAARREILARFTALSGPVSVEDVRARYDFDAAWIERRLTDWARGGRLVRGHFGGDRATVRWVSRRLLDEARRRELAEARRQVRPVSMETFARFLQRWQHLERSAKLTGSEGSMDAVRQLYGIARPAESWERDYLPSRLDSYDPEAVSRMCATGEMIWVGSAGSDEGGGPRRLAAVRFIRRGSGRAWLRDVDTVPELGDAASRVHHALATHGASFFADLQAATSLGTLALRDALRELAAAGLVTNDTIDALRDVARWRAVLPGRGRTTPDPTRWLPEDFVASRPVVQRRPNIRRLPKWKRPDKEGGERPWLGRWSLVHTPGTLGPEVGEETLAEEVARQWLDRYGIVSRDWWRRERPAVSWRAIYYVLRRLEYRGEVRRGYFVQGLAGAQFARGAAVEDLRATADAPRDESVTVMAASDPANPYSLAPAPGSDPADRDASTRPRGRGALLVMRGGRVLLAVESRGKRVRVGAEASEADVLEAAAAMIAHLGRRVGGKRAKDIVIERIDDAPATTSPHAEAFARAGFKRGTTTLVFYAGV